MTANRTGVEFPSRAAFAAWLAAQPPGASVGRRGVGTGSVLTRFLHAQGYRNGLVYGTGWTPDLLAQRPLPLWAAGYQARLLFTGDRRTSITAAEALGVLEGIE